MLLLMSYVQFLQFIHCSNCASKVSGIAWVLLNMTSLYCVVFGSWILKEKIGKFDVLVLLVVTVMTLLTR